METIAEYVETDALRSRMADLGVDYGQGFAMGKAQPLEDLLQELAIYEATMNTWNGTADVSEGDGGAVKLIVSG
jgi:sensor c-di-GMP phosphodiesterase-like protein